MDREEKEKDRDRERQRDSRGREKERDKEREKLKLKEKDKDRDMEKKERGGKEPERAYDKEKDRERGKDKERSGKDLEKEKDREREKEKEKDRVKDQERGKDKAKDQEREKDRAKDHEREKDRTKDQEREKDRTRDQERDRKKEREKEKNREHSKKDEDREKEKEKKRERERGKDRERDDNDPEKDREREVWEKERERDKEWDKEREKENEREKEKDHQKSRGGRDKDRDNREKEHRDHDRVNNNNNRHKDWTQRDRERETEKDHEAEKGEKQTKKDDKERASKEAHGPRPSASELEERITKMREERHKASAEQRSSAKKADADDDDIYNWVNKSRKIEHRKKLDDRQKALRMAKMFAEQDNEQDDDNSGDEFNNSGYGGKDLAGLKVRHGFDKVMEGHAIVLTLKDTSVLDGDDVNEAGDELENIEMAEQQARQDAYKAAKKKPGSYEDKFGNDMDALVTERKILPQYDDVVKDEGVILDANGGLSEESKKKLEEVRLRLEGASAKASLSGSLIQPASDYYTEADMLQFKKPKKKKKLRKRDKIDVDELEAEAVAAGLGAGDLGSRDSEGRNAQRLADEKAAADARKNAYQNALNKAEDASMVLRKETRVEPMEVEKAESPTYVGDDDDDFYKSLDRARQAALQNQRNSGNLGTGPQSVVARLAALNQEAVSSSQTQAGAETQEGGLVFTDTGEFCRSLQLDDAITRRERPKDVFAEDEEEEPAEEMEIDTSKLEGGWTEVVDVDKKHPVGEEETDGGEPSEEPIREVSVGKGLAGALSLLKERGTLKETTDWGGRNMDKKRSKLVGIIDESNNQVGQRDILLDRVDEFGRMMTPKEAFRKLSHKFHGKGPGKMKQEKKQKQFQEELRLKQMNSGDTPLMSMQKMREAQARMHTPYIVISGHIKPGQTSDPRSGFGTVEKEPIGSLTPMLGDKSAGSLTPMLGDKKVEHFLGIKRKPDSGFKEPPPKQPKFER